MSIKVFIADDHQMFREGLKAKIDNMGNMVVIDEAGDGREAVKQIESKKPDIAVLDIAMPVLNGIEATRRILKSIPDQKIVMLSMLAEQMYVVEAIQAGARGYMLKGDSFSQLVEAFEIVMDGGTFLSKAIEKVMVDDLVNQIRHGEINGVADPLTDREREILQLVAEGNTNRTIADELNISVNTVDTHRKKIMDKLSIHNTAGLVMYAIKHNIVIQ